MSAAPENQTSSFSDSRSPLQLMTGAFGLYRRYPLLFFVLAVVVIVPYESIVLAATGAGPLARSSLSFGVSQLLTAIEWFFISPLVSALHVHAVAEVREGRDPRLLPIARQGLLVLPVVVAAAIISGLGIAVGFLALILPGAILWLRWSVVAQSAAIEHEGWQLALRRSRQLTAGNYRHIIVFQIVVGVIVTAPTLLVGFIFGHHSTTVASFLVGLIVFIFTWSFTALATALLYFDLRIRYRPSQGPWPGEADRSSDPRQYSDQNRPRGWYVDPDDPEQMRFWEADDPPGWAGSTKTPWKLRRAWRKRDDGKPSSP